MVRHPQPRPVYETLRQAHLLDGTHGVLRQRHGRGHPALPAVRHRSLHRRLDPCGARLVHRRVCRRHPHADGLQLHLRLRRVQAGAVRRPRSQARELQPSADALVLLLQPEQRRLCPRARHVRYRPYCEHARLEHGRGRVAFGVSRVRHRYDAHPQLENGAVRARNRADRGDLVHVLPEEARVLPPAGAREKLPHHRRLQRGHHRRDDDENARR